MKKLIYKSRDNADIAVYFFEYDSNAPLVFDIHGGGFVAGCAKDDFKLCTDILERAKVNVATVEYRYAAEVTFPKATDDCLDALLALVADENTAFDRGRVYLLGHSAGANAASAVAQQTDKIKGVILDYPFLNAWDNDRKYVLGGFNRLQIWNMTRQYFKDVSARKSPIASAVYMKKEEAESFPKTLIFICGRDTLAVDGAKFHSLLRSYGKSSKLVKLDSAEHGFIEIISSGRMKPTLFRSKKSVKLHFEYYEKFLTELSKFIL